jgi:Asp-tRNA(Asn)/Glu-tRNA(Gln) amidotransferase A subunit family amidase
LSPSPELQKAFHDQSISCRALVRSYLDRIAAYNGKGPAINAILTLNPSAMTEADTLDAAFVKGGSGRPAPLRADRPQGQLTQPRPRTDLIVAGLISGS